MPHSELGGEHAAHVGGKPNENDGHCPGATDVGRVDSPTLTVDVGFGTDTSVKSPAPLAKIT